MTAATEDFFVAVRAALSAASSPGIAPGVRVAYVAMARASFNRLSASLAELGPLLEGQERELVRLGAAEASEHTTRRGATP